jgi:hypothetical protein
VLVVAPQLAQFLTIGTLDFSKQRFDRIIALIDDTIAPAFGAVMLLNRMLTLVVNFSEGGDNSLGVARAQQFTEELVMPFEGAALVVNTASAMASSTGSSSGMRARCSAGSATSLLPRFSIAWLSRLS